MTDMEPLTKNPRITPHMVYHDPGGFLSFWLHNTEGLSKKSFPVHNLNVFIGPNGSGKSNLIESLCLLQSLPISYERYIAENGGYANLQCKLIKDPGPIRVGSEFSFGIPNTTVIYNARISFDLNRGYRFEEFAMLKHILDKRTTGRIHLDPILIRDTWNPVFTYVPSIFYTDTDTHSVKIQTMPVDEVNRFDQIPRVSFTDKSVLGSMFTTLPDTVIPSIGTMIREMWISKSRSAAVTNIREPQSAEQPSRYLDTDYKNFGLFIQDLKKQVILWNEIVMMIQHCLPRFRDINIDLKSRNIVIYIIEDGMQYEIPASRISDGTLSFISLVILLMQPNPPPVICIEEPEIGLHPDMIHQLAGLLFRVSEKSQIFITTHSDLFVSAIGNVNPEAVVITEWSKFGTQFRRLNSKKLRSWLDQYSLGELWLSGQLGGTTT